MKKLLIISKSKNLYSVRRLHKEAENMFAEIEVFSYKDLSITYKKNKLSFRVADRNVSDYTHIISRISDKFYPVRYLLAKEASHSGVRMLNSEAILNMPHYNKLTQLYLLGSIGLPLPETHFILRSSNLSTKGKVLKKAKSSRLGKGMSVVNPKDVNTAFDFTLRDYLFQELLPYDSDLRIMVIGGKVIGAVKRAAKYANRNADSEEFDLHNNAELVKLAQKAAKALKAEYIGLDIMQTKLGPVILEANLDAGFKTFDKLTHRKTAVHIIKQLLNDPQYGP
ncbi:MAG: RimK family alpha-L-glutamate ligase [Candidatus Dojkabacteria bacterium]